MSIILTIRKSCHICSKLTTGSLYRLTNRTVKKIGENSKIIYSLKNTKHNYYLVNKLNFTTTTQLCDNPNSRKDLQWQKTPQLTLKSLPKYCLMLSKIRLTSLVVITSMAGYALAPAPFNLTTFTMCSVGTALLSCAANSINQFFEVPFDSQMSRTKNRVLVRGLLLPIHAVAFAFITATSGITILYNGVNSLTTLLGLGNLLLYTCIYTPMKRISILNTWVGSIVGAIPPLMGWAACDDSLGLGAGLLAILLYSWQFPHFNALSWNLRPDYSRAGYRMMAVTDPALCRRVALRHTAIITSVCCCAPYLDITNVWFTVGSLPLNCYFMYLAWNFYKKSDSNSSRKLFRFSLIHLPTLMFLFLINKKHWSSEQEKDNTNQLKENRQSLEKKFIAVLPRGPIVNAHSETEKNI